MMVAPILLLDLIMEDLCRFMLAGFQQTHGTDRISTLFGGMVHAHKSPRERNWFTIPTIICVDRHLTSHLHTCLPHSEPQLSTEEKPRTHKRTHTQP